MNDDNDRRERFELEIEQIRANIEQSRAETTRAAKQARWYELVLFAAGGAGLVTLGMAVAEFIGRVPNP